MEEPIAMTLETFNLHEVYTYMYMHNTVEPLMKDTLNKGHICIKDTFKYTNLYSGNTLLPLKEDNLSIIDKMIRPNVSVI